ncbi:hypothetical protein C8R46DRAFT_287973 [Mycena filopes]|nr:hypothetical protein C8R46DRAFT_287973 [Mycena filopes]
MQPYGKRMHSMWNQRATPERIPATSYKFLCPFTSSFFPTLNVLSPRAHRHRYRLRSRHAGPPLSRERSRGGIQPLRRGGTRDPHPPSRGPHPRHRSRHRPPQGTRPRMGRCPYHSRLYPRSLRFRPCRSEAAVQSGQRPPRSIILRDTRTGARQRGRPRCHGSGVLPRVKAFPRSCGRRARAPLDTGSAEQAHVWCGGCIANGRTHSGRGPVVPHLHLAAAAR